MSGYTYVKYPIIIVLDCQKNLGSSINRAYYVCITQGFYFLKETRRRSSPPEFLVNSPTHQLDKKMH